MQKQTVEQGLSPLSENEMKQVEGGAIPEIHIEWVDDGEVIGGIWITDSGFRAGAAVSKMGELGGGQPQVIKEGSER